MFSYLELENKEYDNFYVKFCGMQQCEPDYSYGPAIRSHYLIHYCVSGKGKYHVNNKVYTIRPGDAFMIMPDIVTYYQADHVDPWTYIWIAFDGQQSDMFLEQCGIDKEHLIVHSDYIDELRDIVVSMLEHNKLSYANEMFIQGKLFEFFSYFAKSADIPYEEEVSTTHNTYVNKAIQYIQNNYQNYVTVTEIADYLSLNRSYFTTLFKQYMHMSPQQFLLEYRMMMAEDFLVNTHLTINQIAYSCGYSNQLSFSKAFHNTHGMSPRDYRNQYKLDDNHSRSKDPHTRKKQVP